VLDRSASLKNEYSLPVRTKIVLRPLVSSFYVKLRISLFSGEQVPLNL
jgi:hypothetical protein